MENITNQQILGVITSVLVLILIAPNIIRFNLARGTTLRNIALWLLIFVGLLWAYELTHPGASVAPEPAPYTEPTPMGEQSL